MTTKRGPWLIHDFSSKPKLKICTYLALKPQNGPATTMLHWSKYKYTRTSSAVYISLCTGTKSFCHKFCFSPKLLCTRTRCISRAGVHYFGSSPLNSIVQYICTQHGGKNGGRKRKSCTYGMNSIKLLLNNNKTKIT